MFAHYQPKPMKCATALDLRGIKSACKSIDVKPTPGARSEVEVVLKAWDLSSVILSHPEALTLMIAEAIVA